MPFPVEMLRFFERAAASLSIGEQRPTSLCDLLGTEPATAEPEPDTPRG